MSRHEDRLSETQVARADLHETFALLSDRLNVAKRFDDAVELRTEQIKELKKKNPAVFVAAVASVAMLAGVATWAVTTQILKRFR